MEVIEINKSLMSRNAHKNNYRRMLNFDRKKYQSVPLCLSVNHFFKIRVSTSVAFPFQVRSSTTVFASLRRIFKRTLYDLVYPHSSQKYQTYFCEITVNTAIISTYSWRLATGHCFKFHGAHKMDSVVLAFFMLLTTIKGRFIQQETKKKTTKKKQLQTTWLKG